MGSIKRRRLEALEGQTKVPEDELRERVYREFLRRLTDEESEWLSEPSREAEMLVVCPIHGPGCHCTNEERRQRARVAHPELHEEFERRNRALLERREQIMAREPYQETSADRRRLERVEERIGARASPGERPPWRTPEQEAGRERQFEELARELGFERLPALKNREEAFGELFEEIKAYRNKRKEQR